MALTEMEQLVQDVTDIRQKLKHGRDAFKTFEDATKEAVAAAEAALLAKLNELGVDSIRALGQTVYTERTEKFACSDWDAFYKAVAASDRFDLIQKRLGATALKDYEAEHGALPPGVSKDVTRELRIRKAA
jgi:hypothetical protein